MVKQAAQVLDLLEFFSRHKRPATPAEISQHLAWPRSSTFNLLNMLISRGFLYEPRPKGGLYPSSRWTGLSEEIRISEPSSAPLHALIEELSLRSGETVVLAAPAGAHALFMDVVESRHAVRYTAQTGLAKPMHATATGRALLSQRSEEERTAFLRKVEFVKYTPTTLMSADAVEREIKRSIKRGWFLGNAELSLGLGGLAVALPMPARHYAILIAGPMDRIGERHEELMQIVRQATEEILDMPLPGTDATPMK